ncbi:MAG: hypothetical protein WC750_06020 [Patescibacteria group bacterium]|jgi:hypothetical protein
MKVPDAVIKTKDLELVEFMDYVQTILNNGLYEMRIFDAVPTWESNNGETGILVTGSNRQLYFYLNGVWNSIGFNSLGTLVLFDKDQDTGITPEATADEDVIRFYTAGYYYFSMGTYGFSVAAGKPIFLDGTISTASGTAWVFDTATSYLTAYVGGVKRIEM